MKQFFFLFFIFLNCLSLQTNADENLSLREIYVITDVLTPGEITSGQSSNRLSLSDQFHQDTASLLNIFTGVDNAVNGSVSSIPYMRGLNDTRIRISVDGIDLQSACTSHSDPTLSLVNINDVEYVKVFAGITPVSMGGDSIAGTIKVKTGSPIFSNSEELVESSSVRSFYKSNNDEQGTNLKTSLASDSFYVSYSGSYSESNNYSAGSNSKDSSYGGSSDKSVRNDEVGSSGYRMENHQIHFAKQIDNHLMELKLSYQNSPYQGYMNQRMDVIGQNSHKINFTDTIKYGWGKLEFQAYHNKIETKMNFGKDKNFNYMGTPGMSMTHHGFTSGVNINSEVYLDDKNTMRYGLETQLHEVDDEWDPTGGMMSPNILKNINDGKRDRYSAFAELDRQWNTQWYTQTGFRLSKIRMDSGDVQGYDNSNMMMYGNDVNSFNSQNRKKDDTHLDLSLTASYSPDLRQTHEFGYSLKNRSATLQERYLWSNAAMVSSMANWFGDGNGYVGDVNLDKETAHTFAYSAVFHDENKNKWNISFNPYLTYVDDYIDAVSFVSRADGFRTLTLGNQNAKIYGLDVKGMVNLGNFNGFGDFSLNTAISYARGQNTDTNDDLYHVMPLNMKVILSQKFNHWSNSINIQVVDNKDRTNNIRQEMETSGYALVDLKTAYQKNNFLVNVGVYNLFDREYDHPLGGVYFGQGRTMATNTSGVTYANALNVPGMGRAIFSSVQYSF